MNAQTVVADVADELARRVASGEYAPGDLVPSVRQVASEFEVNRATAQLILGRLESAGFVDAKRGKGFTVRDVRLSGGMDVYRRLFRLSMPMPEVVLDTFHDIVTAERQLVLDTVRAYTDLDEKFATADLTADVDHLEQIALAEDPNLAEFLNAELSILRNLLSALGRTVQLATLNSIGEMVQDVPEAMQAFFVVTPDVHVLVWRALVSVWDQGQPSESEVSLFEDLITMYHDRVLARFTELVERGTGSREAGMQRVS